jgi:phospholipid/cholesterol/gamma-HCH transport system substrate-binding protein
MSKRVLGALVGAIVLLGVGLFLFSQEMAYTVQVAMPSAAQLTDGSPVVIAGRTVGEVSDLRVQDGKAVVTARVSGADVPLRQGTTSSVQWLAVLGERVLTLYPGPAEALALPSGALLDAPSRQIEVDQVLAALDPPTRTRLTSLIHELNSTVSGAEPDLRATLRSAGPTIAALGQLMDAAGKDGPAINSLVREMNSLTSVTAGRHSEVRDVVHDLAGFSQTVAASQRQLADGLARMPDTLRVTHRTLDKVPDTADTVVPLLHDLRPATDRLPRLAADLAPFLRDTRPVSNILRPTLRGLNGVLDRAPRLLDEAHRTLAPLAATIHDYGPALTFLRPYTPEFVGFTMNWGNAFGTYDSQGHVWDGLLAPGPDAFNEGMTHLPGQVKRPKPNPGDAVGQPWVDATGSGPR